MDIRQLNDIKPRFVTRTVGDELVIVPLSGNVAQMNRLFTLNETGKFIWDNSEKCTDIKSLVVLLTENFDVQPDAALTDVEAFLEKMEMLYSDK
ncbi:MAG TPA: PqqD family protein [Paludibacteraceae bacterium]|nr:PqqD family protein [Paludibacteraceae bacterium]